MSEEKNTEENSENQVGEKKKRKNSTFTFEYGDFAYDFLTIRHIAQSKIEGKPIYEEMALSAMEQHYAFYGQLNGVMKVEGYVTRNAIIHCDCGNADIRLDAYEDHGVIAANGEPVLTCDDCQANINIYRFGLCDAEEKYGKLSALRPSGEKEMNEMGIMCYRCMPVLAEKWRQKESDLLIGDVDSGEFAEALKAGAYLTCRYGGIIEVVEVPERIDNAQSEEILPLESKWLEEHTRDIDDIEYVSMEFLNKLGWTEIADYFMDIETGERSDWKRAYNEKKDIFEFNPDPEVGVHTRPINEQDVKNINRVLSLYKINKSKELVCAFMSQIGIECEKGAKMCEQVGKGDIRPKNTTRTEMKRVHEKTRDYPYKFRGGGAMQITNMDIYKEVFKTVADIPADIPDDVINPILNEVAEREYVGDKEGAIEEEKILTIGTEYVAYNYPWLSAGIFWDWKNINAEFKKKKMDGVIDAINYNTPDRKARKDANKRCEEIYEEYAQNIPWETENE